MWALVENNAVTQVYTRPKDLELESGNYPRVVFTSYTTEQLEDIGIYEVIVNNTNFQDKEFYINTDQRFDFADGVVTASYGVATPKVLDTVLFTAQDETDGLGTEGEVAVEGLKTILIRNIKSQAETELSRTDWYITRKSEKNTAIPSAITTHRDAVRSKQDSMCTAITNASDTPALETLYTYTEQEDGSVTRPLGELPTL